MAWNTAGEVVVAGSGQLYVAPVGTALPSTPTAALNAAFVGLGYIAEDGASFKVTPEISEFKAWQSTDAIRRSVKSRELEIGAKLLQWNENTVVTAFGGGAITGSGPYTYTLPLSTDALAEYAVVLDANDGARVTRIVVARMCITDAVEAQFSADSMAELPIVLKSLASTIAPTILFSDTTAFAAGS